MTTKETLRDRFEKWRDEQGGWPSRSECAEWFFAEFDSYTQELVETDIDNIMGILVQNSPSADIIAGLWHVDVDKFKEDLKRFFKFKENNK